MIFNRDYSTSSEHAMVPLWLKKSYIFFYGHFILLMIFRMAIKFKKINNLLWYCNVILTSHLWYICLFWGLEITLYFRTRLNGSVKCLFYLYICIGLQAQGYVYWLPFRLHERANRLKLWVVRLQKLFGFTSPLVSQKAWDSNFRWVHNKSLSCILL